MTVSFAVRGGAPAHRSHGFRLARRARHSPRNLARRLRLDAWLSLRHTI